MECTKKWFVKRWDDLRTAASLMQAAATPGRRWTVQGRMRYTVCDVSRTEKIITLLLTFFEQSSCLNVYLLACT